MDMAYLRDPLQKAEHKVLRYPKCLVPGETVPRIALGSAVGSAVQISVPPVEFGSATPLGVSSKDLWL